MKKLKDFHGPLQDNEESIHKKLERGFVWNTVVELENEWLKTIMTLEIGDILKGGHVVMGIVEINDKDIFRYNINNKIYYGNNLINIEPMNHVKKTNRKEKLYHIITNSGKLYFRLLNSIVL